MQSQELSDFEVLSTGKIWPGYCQIVQATPTEFSLNFSRVPMCCLPPRPSGCSIYLSIEEAFQAALAEVEFLKKVLNPNHITLIQETPHD